MRKTKPGRVPNVRRTRPVNIAFAEGVIERLGPPAEARGITVPDLVRTVIGEWLEAREAGPKAAAS